MVGGENVSCYKYVTVLANDTETIKLKQFYGTENDLNHILSTFVDSEHEIATFCDSSYITISDIQSIIKNHDKEFSILSLNTQSINAKFDKIYAIVNSLSSLGHYFGAICLQETWLRNDADISLFNIPGYRLIHQGSKCTKHGGLIMYLNERYSYKLRNLYTGSDIWEGLFVDVTGYNLRRPLTIGNIYRPPHDNNSNKQRFLTPGHQGWNDLHSLCRIGMEYYLLNNDDHNIIYWIMMIIMIMMMIIIMIIMMTMMIIGTATIMIMIIIITTTLTMTIMKMIMIKTAQTPCQSLYEDRRI